MKRMTMKVFKSLLLINLLLSSATGFSQDTRAAEVERIKQLSRDSIIKLAFQMIKEDVGPNKSIKFFDKITVLANKTSIRVLFSNPIKYVPLNSASYYDIGVDIINQSLTYGPVSNPKDYTYKRDNTSFFSPTEESEKNIQFVINALNKSEPETPIDSKKSLIKNMDGSLIIRENKTYYDIERISESQESSYKIDKKSGKIYDENHNHLRPAPQAEEYKDEFVEIK